MGHTHKYQFDFKKKSGKESQYMVSHPELSSDPPIGSDRESGCDRTALIQGSKGEESRLVAFIIRFVIFF